MPVLYIWLICVVVAAMLAQSKNRSPLVGGLCGLLGGPIAVVVIACMAKVAPGEPEAKPRARKVEADGTPMRDIARWLGGPAGRD